MRLAVNPMFITTASLTALPDANVRQVTYCQHRQIGLFSIFSNRIPTANVDIWMMYSTLARFWGG